MCTWIISQRIWLAVAWLRHLFNSQGKVIDVYIPAKRSLRYNTKFGFVRFKNKEEALRAIKAFNGVSIRNFIMLNWLDFLVAIGSQILVKIKYHQEGSHIAAGTNLLPNSISGRFRDRDSVSVERVGPSLADVVSGHRSTSFLGSLITKHCSPRGRH